LLLLVRFDTTAEIDPNCDVTPVREIDPDSIEIAGSGSKTNITGALQLALDRLRPYVQSLAEHSEHAEHPLLLLFLFSDGQHNVGESPQRAATEIKQPTLDGEPVVIAAAGELTTPKQETVRNAPNNLLRTSAKIEDLQTRPRGLPWCTWSMP
jgi:hypothetical protein